MDTPTPIKLRPEVKTLWLAALRSGNYKQGRTALNRDNKLCCLGVLCEVAIENGVHLEKARYLDGSSVAYNHSRHYLPAAVCAWAGLPTDLANRDIRVDAADGLGERNDQGADFATIADLIEANL